MAANMLTTIAAAMYSQALATSSPAATSPAAAGTKNSGKCGVGPNPRRGCSPVLAVAVVRSRDHRAASTFHLCEEIGQAPCSDGGRRAVKAVGEPAVSPVSAAARSWGRWCASSRWKRLSISGRRPSGMSAAMIWSSSGSRPWKGRLDVSGGLAATPFFLAAVPLPPGFRAAVPISAAWSGRSAFRPNKPRAPSRSAGRAQ